MKLPGVEKAEVPFDKVVRYLLNAEHPNGASKAVFFRSFGFHLMEWRRLAEELRRHAEANEVKAAEQSEFGVRYVIEGPLACPDGRSPRVRAIWFIEEGQGHPRLVTAFPLRLRPRS